MNEKLGLKPLSYIYLHAIVSSVEQDNAVSFIQ